MRRTILLILALLVPPAASVGIAHLMDRARYPRRFEEVVSAKMYRGGFPEAGQLSRLKQEKSIRTVVSLTQDLKREKDATLAEEARQEGLRHFRFEMPGDGRGEYEIMDRAAAAVANPENWPVFFHCAAGEQRSNAVLAAYRLKYCRWSLDKVRAELETHGLDLEDPKEALLWEHIQGYDKWLHTMTPAPTSRPAARDLNHAPPTAP